MDGLPYASGAAFRRRMTFASSIPGTAAAVVVIFYLLALLQLDTAAWMSFGKAIGVLVLILTPLGQWIQHVYQKEIVRVIDLEAAGEATHDDFQSGFVAASAFPRKMVVAQSAHWLLAAIVAPMWMDWDLGGVGGFVMIVIAVAAATACFATSPLIYYVLKQIVHPLREHWARHLSPDEREAGNTPVLLWVKLAGPVGALCCTTVVFSGLLAYALANRPVEAQDAKVKGAFLQYAATELAANPRRDRRTQRDRATVPRRGRPVDRQRREWDGDRRRGRGPRAARTRVHPAVRERGRRQHGDRLGFELRVDAPAERRLPRRHDPWRAVLERPRERPARLPRGPLRRPGRRDRRGAPRQPGRHARERASGGGRSSHRRGRPSRPHARRVRG